MVRLIREAGFWLGVGAVAYGCWSIWPPLAWLVGGLAVAVECCIGLVMQQGGKERRR